MIRLERFHLNDANAYLEIAQDANVEKFFRLAYCKDLEEAQDLMELCVNSCNYDAFKILDEQNQMVGDSYWGEKAQESNGSFLFYFCKGAEKRLL